MRCGEKKEAPEGQGFGIAARSSYASKVSFQSSCGWEEVVSTRRRGDKGERRIVRFVVFQIFTSRIPAQSVDDEEVGEVGVASTVHNEEIVGLVAEG